MEGYTFRNAAPLWDRHPVHETAIEAYHRRTAHNKHLVYDIRLALLVLIGTVVLVVCVVYLIIQCRLKPPNLTNVFKYRGHRQRDSLADQEKLLLKEDEAFDHKVSPSNVIRLEPLKLNQGFYV